MPKKELVLLFAVILLVSSSVAQTYLLNESFTSATFPPTGWLVQNFNGFNTWQRVTINPNTQPACAGVESDGQWSRNNDWLITPQIGPIISGDSLVFYARRGPYSLSETLYIRISSAPNQNDTSQYSIVYKIAITSSNWTRFARSLNNYAGNSIYIAFWYRELNRDRVRIDDVQVVRYTTTYYTVTFTANGLPAGTSWTVTWNGTPYTSTTNTITISNVSAGTYNWSVSSPISGGTGVQYVGSPTSGSMNVPTQTSQTITWTTQYYLTVSSAHGATTGEGWYDAGVYAYAGVDDSIVTVDDTQYVFAGWTGDATGSNLTSDPILMDGPKTATASWDTYYWVTYAANVSVTLPADEWVKSGEPATGIFPSEEISDGTKYVYVSDDRPATITEPTTITGYYDTYYSLTINIVGSGSVNRDPEEEWYLSSSIVELTAIPDFDWVFTGWSGDLTGSNNPEYLTMDGPKNVTATFTEVYHDVAVASIVQPSGSVPICTPFAPTIEIYNYSTPSRTEHCTLDVYIWRYPIKFDTVCRVSRNPSESILVYSGSIAIDVDPGSNNISLANWHPYYADLISIPEPTYHVIHASVRMPLDENPDNNHRREQFNVTGIENDLQVNGLTLLRGQSVIRGDTVLKTITYNTMSAVSNNSPTKRLTVRSYFKITRVRTNATIYSRYCDCTLNPQSYICISYSSGVSFQDTGLYKMETWIQTAQGVDVTPNNNRMERYFYVKYVPTNTQGDEGEVTLSEFNLFNATPNPLRNFTEIRWQIPKTSKVRVAIYNATGQLIKTLVDGYYEAGDYRVSWNRTDNYGRRVSAGIYFYEFTTNEFSSRKKLVLTE
ncbi:MAG: T9SS type A sorting domain-containing protein [candidate division WOR-3 bacterium]